MVRLKSYSTGYDHTKRNPNGNYYTYSGSIGIMEKNMETTIYVVVI